VHLVGFIIRIYRDAARSSECQIYSWTSCNPKDSDHSVALYLRCARKCEVKSTTALKHKTWNNWQMEWLTDLCTNWRKKTEQMTNETNGLIGIAEFESRQKPEIFLFCKMPRPALCPTQPLIQREPGVISRGKMARAWSWPLLSKSA
jgi:hypothetical protein